MPGPGRLRASIVVVGDEILGGFVQDTNSGWLAQRLRTLGIPLERIVTVPDTVTAICEALATELARARPRIVLTSGGIGSTPDDVTLAAVATHLQVDLVTEPAIDARITQALEWIAAQGMTVTAEHEQSMRKMALVPAGSYLLAGVEALAPGVAVDVQGGCRTPAGATIVILPGIPSEFRRITEEGVEPELLADRGSPSHVVELSHPYPESAVNAVLDRVVEDFPDVHVGSYPGRECLVRLQGDKPRVEAAAERIAAFLAELANTPGAAQLREAWQSRWH